MALRTLIIIFLLSLGPIWWLWATLTDHFARPWIGIAAPMLTALMGLVVYLAFGRQRFRQRLLVFGVIFAIFVGTGIFLSQSLVYVGSVDGSSLPQLDWKWNTNDEVSFSGAPKKATSEGLSDVPLPGLLDSPQFLAPKGNGQRSVEQLTARFDNWDAAPPKELWRIPVGTGWSGFSTAGRRALTMEQLGEEETVTCYDLATGDLLWKTGIDARYYSDALNPMTQMAGDGPRATPTIVEDRVYTFGATGTLLCLELESGEILWQTNPFGTLETLPEWGKSSSVLHLAGENLVVVSGPEKDGPTLLAFDAATGSPAWTFRETRPDGMGSENFGGSYSTPLLASLFGKRQIISVNASSVTGVAPGSGELIWRFIWTGTFPKVGQPVVISSDETSAQILVTASYGVGSHLIEVTQAGDASEVWQSTRLKTKFSSAVVNGNYAYGFDEAKPACIDLATGDRVWKARADYGYGQNLLVGEHLLIQAEAGHVAVIEASPEGMKEVGRIENTLSSLTWNTPAIAGRYLLIRNDREAICYQLPPTL